MHLQELSSDYMNELTHRRIGERRVGQCLLDRENNLGLMPGKFAIIGIPESIGPRANGGRIGAERAWECFLKVFLNSQVHDDFIIEDIGFIGQVQVEDLQAKSLKKSQQALLRELVETCDLRVKQSIAQVLEAGLIPIVIGGGHNNSFPILQALHAHVKKQIQVWNFDPHADFRPLEGRHSGNGFSYAMSQEILSSYTVLGFEEAFNNQYIHRQRKEGHFKAVELAELFPLDQKIPLLHHQLDMALPLGLEIDMDAVSRMPASAYNPAGFDLTQLRQMLRILLHLRGPSYFHLPEAAPASSIKQELTVGKSLTLLVRDFIRFYPS